MAELKDILECWKNCISNIGIALEGYDTFEHFKATAEEYGADVSKMKEIPYTEFFAYKFWEFFNIGFHNYHSRFTILIEQLYLKYLEILCENKPSDYDIKLKLLTQQNKFKQISEETYYMD